MTAETTLRIARNFSNVIAIKEASGNITQMDDIIKNKTCLLYTSVLIKQVYFIIRQEFNSIL